MVRPLGIVVPAYQPDVGRLERYLHALHDRLAPATVRVELDQPGESCSRLRVGFAREPQFDVVVRGDDSHVQSAEHPFVSLVGPRRPNGGVGFGLSVEATLSNPNRDVVVPEASHARTEGRHPYQPGRRFGHFSPFGTVQSA